MPRTVGSWGAQSEAGKQIGESKTSRGSLITHDILVRFTDSGMRWDPWKPFKHRRDVVQFTLSRAALVAAGRKDWGEWDQGAG